MSTVGAVEGVSRGRSVWAAIREFRGLRTSGLVFATGILLIILAIKDPAYLSIQNLKIVGIQVTEVGIAAVGTTFLMISGNVDLSIGSMTGLVATGSALLSLSIPEPWPLILGVLMGVVSGLFNGLLVWRIRISPIIITIGGLSLMYGIALLLNNGAEVPNVPNSFTTFGGTDVFGFSIGFVFFIGLCAGGWLFLSTTLTGRHLYAVGGNREAAARVGIPIRRIVIGTFMFNGLLIGLGGILIASRYGTASPQFGVGLEVQAITAVILGGVAFTGGEGGMGGVLVAVIFLGILESAVVALGINPYYANVIQGAALIVAVTMDQLAREQHERRRRAIALMDAAPLEQADPADPDTVLSAG